MTLWQNKIKMCFRTIKRKFQYASEKESLERTHGEDSCSGRKDPSADFGRSKTIVAKISINCGCKRANNASNCGGRSSIQIIHIKNTTDLLRDCQDQASCSLQALVQEFWPSNSPDLNPLDYYAWSAVERVTNKSRHPNVMPLRTAIQAAFADIDSVTLQRAYERFRLRIEAVIEADGDYIE